MTHITEEQARTMTICPCCEGEKRIGLVVCWYCFKNKPKHSAWVMPGYKYWNGTLDEFVNTSNIPF